MIKKRISDLKKLMNHHNLDGYIVPKNDAYFSEYSLPDRLKIISNFSGSAGFAVILKNKNYLFVDGRYTIQAVIESGKYFEIKEIPKFSTDYISIKNKKKLSLGFDPQLFTTSNIKKKFNNTFNLCPVSENLIDKIFKNKTKKSVELFYLLNDKITGEKKILKSKDY